MVENITKDILSTIKTLVKIPFEVTKGKVVEKIAPMGPGEAPSLKRTVLEKVVKARQQK